VPAPVSERNPQWEVPARRPSGTTDGGPKTLILTLVCAVHQPFALSPGREGARRQAILAGGWGHTQRRVTAGPKAGRSIDAAAVAGAGVRAGRNVLRVHDLEHSINGQRCQ